MILRLISARQQITLNQPPATVTEELATDPTVSVPTEPTKFSVNPKPISETEHPSQRRLNDQVQAPGAVARTRLSRS